MKFTREDSDDNPEINIISLIDVILVLLIFFMATATFEQQARLKLNLPQASDTQTESDRSAALTVQVAEDGRYFIGAAEVNGGTIEVLKLALSEASGGDYDQRVILRADARTPHQSVVTALDALGQAGFVNISIATVRAEQ
jgi:biopolymer transport protein ExbD